MQLKTIKSSFEDCDKDYQILNELITKGEQIDVSDVTLSRSCSLLLTNYALTKGIDKVVGCKEIQGYGKFIDKPEKQLYITKDLLLNKVNNFGLDIQPNTQYQVVISNKNRIACYKILAFLLLHNRNAIFVISNFDIIGVYKYLTEKASSLIARKDCEEFYEVDNQNITVLSKEEVLQKAKLKRLDLESYILLNDIIPTWVFGNNSENHLNDIRDLGMIITQDVSNMANKYRDLEFNKRKLSDIIGEDLCKT